MKNINLLPKVPYVEKNFFPLSMSLIGLFVIISGSILIYSFRIDTTKQGSAKNIAALEAEMQLLSKQKQPSPLHNDFNEYMSVVRTLKTSRIYWTPALDALTSNLPPAARILSAEVAANANATNNANNGSSAANGSNVNNGSNANNGTSPSVANTEANEPNQIQVQYEFADLNQAVDYVLRLQQSPLIGKVNMNAATRMEKQVADKSNDPAGAIAEQPANMSLPTDASSAKVTTGDDIVKSLEKDIKPAENKGDELLNQLRWMIAQQMADHNFGIKAPDKNFIAPDNASGSEISPLLQDDYAKAKAQYEAFKNQNIGGSKQAPAPNAQSPEQAPERTLVSYQVSLQITLKSPAKEK